MTLHPSQLLALTAPQADDLQPDQPQRKADILIVDDIPDNIRFLSSFLLEQGYQVRKAINAQMASIAIRTLHPDLILLDVNLPDVNGYEICRQLKADPTVCHIPIIFLSAGNDAIDKVKAFQQGAADYITKPFYLEEVLVRIQTQLTIQGLQRELKTQNKQLIHALENLKVAQANLVQQEKMATLRKVVAGVAHEINNPLSFIACNVKPAQEYITHLLTLIKLYQQKYPDSDDAIQALLEEIDLDFMTSDLKNIIASMGNGAERIRTVVLALRIFARLDESGIKQVNIQESIASALAMLRHRLGSRSDGHEIRIQKEPMMLPPITGYADQFNQAIFNLLCNAIDAIDEKIGKQAYGNTAPEISIQTELIDERAITIRIRDNGAGVLEENRSRIFEPFFTTRAAGHGVGLGLPISKRIIEEMHGGCLTYQSSPDWGTEFLVQVPLSIAPLSEKR